jgi:hypothetical protein
MLALFSVPALGTPLETSEIYFEENFETYPVGSFPSERFYTYWGGWSIAQENTNKFLRSNLSPQGGNYLLFTQQNFPGNTIIEYKMRHVRDPQYGPVEVSMSISEMVNQNNLAIGFFIRSDGLYGIAYWWEGLPTSQSITKSNAPIVIQSGVWYNAKYIIDGSVAKFYVDDTFLIGLDFSEFGFTEISDFKLKFGSWGQRSIDDIIIYERETTINDLIDTVELMNLQQGIENGLDAKLQNVQDSLEAFNADNRNDAINKLNAFINSVEAQRDNKISNEQADYLIAETQKLIDQIS